MLKLALLCALALATPAAAQESAGAFPKRIPSPGGEVVIAGPTEQAFFDRLHFASARRAGDFLYLSGVVARRNAGEGRDVEAYKAQVRRAFRAIKGSLKAGGASFSDVVMLNTFHVWDGPDFQGDKNAQFSAFGAVKDEFVSPPYPAWTAVGTTGLLGPGGLVEIQVVAYAPQKR